jgi:hypothetical protein
MKDIKESWKKTLGLFHSTSAFSVIPSSPRPNATYGSIKKQHKNMRVGWWGRKRVPTLEDGRRCLVHVIHKV